MWWGGHQDDSAALVRGAVLAPDAGEEDVHVLAAALANQSSRDQAVELWSGVLLQGSAHAHDALVRGRIASWHVAREAADGVVCVGGGRMSTACFLQGAAAAAARRVRTVRLRRHVVLGTLRVLKNPGEGGCAALCTAKQVRLFVPTQPPLKQGTQLVTGTDVYLGNELLRF